MHLTDTFHDLATQVRNWGRWGDDDERGTLNLLDGDAIRRGRDAVVDGRALSLALTLSDEGPQAGLVPGRENPSHRIVLANESLVGDPAVFATSDDAITTGLQAATHWDALAHVSYGGLLYNGFPSDTVDEKLGASRCGIDKTGPIVGRGVLLDLARARGVQRLDPGQVVTGEDLDAAAEFAHITIQPGDLVLLRTGHIQWFFEGDRMSYAFPSPGPGLDAVRWFREHDIAAVATDTLTFEVFPGEFDDLFLPVHLLDLVDMGLTQGQNFDLEALAEQCAEDGRSTFLLSATPERVAGGLGGLCNPVAIR